MFENNRPPEFGDTQPAVAGLDEERAIQFLLEHFKNANLQRQGITRPNAVDFRFTSNEQFWEKILHERNTMLGWVQLSRFQIVDWFPRTPGLYHTRDAIYARREAEPYVKEENGIRFYDPHGKFHMMQGGTGAVRFKPILIEREEHWLCTATADGYAHSGIPIAIPNYLIRRGDIFDYRSWFKIVGQVKFLPKFLEEHFYHMSRVPQIYVLVDSIDTLIKEKSASPVKITPMVFFTGGIEFSRESRRGWGREEKGNVTYVTCRADSLNELDRAADWLNWYAQRYQGEIVTNFDEQRPVFQDAPFSLQNVMSGRLDKYRMRDFHIEHAEIICETVEQFHSVETNLTQQEIIMGNSYKFGNITGSIINIESMFEQVTQSIGALPTTDDTNKKQLVELVGQLKAELQKAPPEKKEEVEAIVESAKALVEAGTKTQPNKTTVQITAEGLKKAAENVAGVMPIVLTIASGIVKTVFQLVGITLP